MPTPQRVAPLLVVGAAVLWGTSGAAQELGPPDLTFPAVAASRALLGGVLLVAVVSLLRGRDRVAAVLRDARAPATLGSVAMAGFQLGYLGGIRLTGVAVGTLVAIGSAPVTAGLIDLLRGRPPGARWLVATVITLSGAALLLVPGEGAAVRPAGVLLSLGAGVAYATYAVASKGMLERGVDSTAAMAVPFLGASAVLVPVALPGDLTWMATPHGMVVTAWLSVVTIAGAYTLFALGLRHLEASKVTTLTLAEPLTAALLAVALLDERLVGAALAGVVLMGVGLLLGGEGRRAPGERSTRVR